MLAELDRLARRAGHRRRTSSAAGTSTPICYRASGRTRLVAEVERLFWRAERYNHLVLSSAERFKRSVA